MNKPPVIKSKAQNMAIGKSSNNPLNNNTRWEGIEPPSLILKTNILPLNYHPMLLISMAYNKHVNHLAENQLELRAAIFKDRARERAIKAQKNTL